ncbi:Hypothetical predicted protein [Lecanosticta acicola]|uniref:Uncharacterized protein n=1 Tax=Lecanosticta acicola TaxID=111012 RepID=A0AAI8YY75_9PEZI|nr:Hypothetical predicted protein [Lecanosticta acicola]
MGLPSASSINKHVVTSIVLRRRLQPPMANVTNHETTFPEHPTAQSPCPTKKHRLSSPPPPSHLLSLPTELRIQILEHVFSENLHHNGFHLRPHSSSSSSNPRLSGSHLDETYTASKRLQPLLVCKTFHREGTLPALQRTHFLVTNLFLQIPQRLNARLHPRQIQALRNLAFVADDRHFRSLMEWRGRPFGMVLELECLTLVLHRTNAWHYLFDFTGDVVRLLRSLRGVRKFVIVRNAALVKGSLKAWYNRLVGLMLKTDHQQRYEVCPPRLEETWWGWEFDEEGQRIVLQAREARGWVEEEEYMRQVLPLMEALRASVESEEWNPDPRARNHYY